MPAHIAVFRPTWLPAPFRNAAYVGSSSETDGRAHNAYVVEYCAKSCENKDILEFVLNYASRAKGTTLRKSSPITEGNGDGSGRRYPLQWFEKGRLEYHAELAGTRYALELGLLGVQALQRRGWLPS
jgi:hypothetical protein